MYIHIHIRTYVHTYISTYVHTYVHTHVHRKHLPRNTHTLDSAEEAHMPITLDGKEVHTYVCGYYKSVSNRKCLLICHISYELRHEYTPIKKCALHTEVCLSRAYGTTFQEHRNTSSVGVPPHRGVLDPSLWFYFTRAKDQVSNSKATVQTQL